MVVRVYSVITETRSHFATYSLMVVRVYSVISETRSQFATYSFMVDCVNCAFTEFGYVLPQTIL